MSDRKVMAPKRSKHKRSKVKQEAAKAKLDKLIKRSVFGGGAISLLGILFYLISAGVFEKEERPSAILARDIQQVATGAVLVTHSLGGAIRPHTYAGRFAVTAEKVPPKVCINVAWQLANLGNVLINNRMPKKLSPQTLKQLCNFYRQGAAITWMPRQAKKRRKA